MNLLAAPTPHRALFAGALLGALVWAMAEARPDDGFSLAMALVLLVCGALSFVCHALSVAPGARERVGGWLLCLGAGVLASLGALSAWPA